MMLLPDRVICPNEFNLPCELKANGKVGQSTAEQAWGLNQSTRWVGAEGVLRGQASIAEFQASHNSHQGLHSRVVLEIPSEAYILQLSFQLVDRKPVIPTARRPLRPF